MTRRRKDRSSGNKAAESPPHNRPAGRFAAALAATVVTVVLWQLAFAPFDLSLLAYIALVPWGLWVLAAGRDRSAMFGGWLMGLIVLVVGLYWLAWVTLPGYLGVVAYLSVYWLVGAWFIRRAHQRGWALWLVLPIVWVSLEYARAHVISGFPWFFLAHSQYLHPRLLQITDVTGQYGVSFFVAMVNGLLLDVGVRALIVKDRPGGNGIVRWLWEVSPRGWSVVGASLVLLLGDVTFRLGQADSTTKPGPRIGVVQCAFPVSLSANHRQYTSEEMFDAHVEQTRRLPLDELDLVVWPESTLPPHVMPGRLYWPWQPLEMPEHADHELQPVVRKMTGDLASLLGDVPLLTGGQTIRPIDPTIDPTIDPNDQSNWQRFNSALLVEAQGENQLRFAGVYDKMHCVPMSEYVPFGDSLPWLHWLLRKTVPRKMPQLTPGDTVQRFSIGKGEQSWTVATAICYEGVFARVCRRLVYDGSEKKADVLVNLSNDGWFIIQSGDWRWGAGELDQHLVAYVFRAIENRVPVIRAVNTGVSGFVDSSGRIVQRVSEEATGLTKMITAVAQRKVLVDERRTLYSLTGDLFAWVCCVAAGVMAVLLWRRHWRNNKSKE